MSDDLVAQLRRCERCQDSGWLWRRELGDPDWDGSADDTRYSCPDCGDRREIAARIAELEAEVARLREEREYWRIEVERLAAGLLETFEDEYDTDGAGDMPLEKAVDATFALCDALKSARDAALARAEEEAANVQKVSALLAAEERQHMKLQHEIMAVAKGDAMHCDANSNLLGIREELLALRARAEAAERERDLWARRYDECEVAHSAADHAHQAAEAALAAERAKRDEADAIFKWLSGEEGEFPDRGAGLYWWRTELRRRVTAWRAKENV